MERNQDIFRKTFHALFRCALVFLASTLAVAGQTSSGETVSPALQVKISTDKTTYEQGDQIPISLQITNISHRDVLIGKEIWGSWSPSKIFVYVVADDGHSIEGIESFADVLSPNAFDDFPRAVLNWCFALPPGYSYGDNFDLTGIVVQSDLVPGSYRVHLEYSSRGVDADTYFNPLLGHPDELAKLRAESWSGKISSNEITLIIVAHRHSGTLPHTARPRRR